MKKDFFRIPIFIFSVAEIHYWSNFLYEWLRVVY